MSKREFQTEVNQLLQLIIHSLYSHPEIFLRELTSNSSDARDKLRHLTLVDDAYKSLPFDPRIDLELDEEKKTLTISDTGIGMSEEDLVSHLGTIARSGTKTFLTLRSVVNFTVFLQKWPKFRHSSPKCCISRSIFTSVASALQGF